MRRLAAHEALVFVHELGGGVRAVLIPAAGLAVDPEVDDGADLGVGPGQGAGGPCGVVFGREGVGGGQRHGEFAAETFLVAKGKAGDGVGRVDRLADGGEFFVGLGAASGSSPASA